MWEVYTTAEAKCKLFKEHFVRKAQLPNNLPELPVLQLATVCILELIVESEEEVLKILKNLDTSKATGPDGISNTLLKRTANAIYSPLCNLFNKSLQNEKFRTTWKEANLLPVFKANDRQATENYRPISLLSNIRKILERTVFMRLYEYCKSRGLLMWRNYLPS